jgi:hypothetical protein
MKITTLAQRNQQALAELKEITKDFVLSLRKLGISISGAQAVQDGEVFSAGIELSESNWATASELSQSVMAKSTHLRRVDAGYSEGHYMWDADAYIKLMVWATFKL